MNLEAIILVSIGFALPAAITVGLFLWGRRETKGLDAALKSVGYRK